MKTYRRIILLIAGVIGILGLLLMASFTTYNACEFANSNTVYIKEQTLLAYKANEIKMVKYHAYRALTSIERSKNNFKDCGCDTASKSIDRTKINLKNATKTSSIYDAKAFVDIALKNTDIGLYALENFGQDVPIDSDKLLALYTTPSNLIDDDIVNLEGNTLSEKIENSTAKFKISLDEMIKINDCAVSLDYLMKTHKLSLNKSLDKTISPGKRHYHKRIKEITSDAIEKMGDCNLFASE